LIELSEPVGAKLLLWRHGFLFAAGLKEHKTSRDENSENYLVGFHIPLSKIISQ
jgi:hypothetical protein